MIYERCVSAPWLSVRAQVDSYGRDVHAHAKYAPRYYLSDYHREDGLGWNMQSCMVSIQGRAVRGHEIYCLASARHGLRERIHVRHESYCRKRCRLHIKDAAKRVVLAVLSILPNTACRSLNVDTTS